MSELVRCTWALRSDEEVVYHDREWGAPRRDDAGLFEFLILESAQAGLSWTTILRKREGYRRAFAGFDAEAVSRFTPDDVERLMLDSGIVRNRLKITSTIRNARLFLDIAARHGSFSAYIWNFVDGVPIINHWRDISEVPASTPISDRIAKEMKRQGFTFFGSTIVYAYMQAVGMVNDHLVGCFRHAELGG